MSVRLAGPQPGVRGSKVDTSLLVARARGVLRAVGHARSELSLSLVDDAEMRELNRSYRQIDRPTDVLSFSLVEGEGAAFRGGLLGDVVIGIETAARQAAARHRAIDEEVARLLVHGVLHLLGHDHEEEGEARRMRAEERRVWRSVREIA
jgi:probable rRNA maturation factor